MIKGTWVVRKFDVARKPAKVLSDFLMANTGIKLVLELPEGFAVVSVDDVRPYTHRQAILDSVSEHGVTTDSVYDSIEEHFDPEFQLMCRTAVERLLKSGHIILEKSVSGPDRLKRGPNHA